MSAGTTTIVFTDLVGSTERMYDLGDKSAAVATVADLRLLGREVERHGGTVTKTLGDGLMARFASVSDGISAGISMQQAVEREVRDTGVAFAQVRIGIHVGDVVADNDDDDVFGTTVVIA